MPPFGSQREYLLFLSVYNLMMLLFKEDTHGPSFHFSFHLLHTFSVFLTIVRLRQSPKAVLDTGVGRNDFSFCRNDPRQNN